jgi:hypothetical protein
MTERRYGEDEIAAIFERAAEAQHLSPRQLPPGEGLTLAELQEIGSDVGLPPALVAEAARSLERQGHLASHRFLGLPIGVGRTLELPRQLTHEEWERLVVDLRETFDARGRVRVDGSFCQWTNGNLQALLEPTATGQRVRFRTLNGNARALMTGGLAIFGIIGAVLVGTAVTGQIGDPAIMRLTGILSALGIGMFGLGAVRLPGWARLRRRQMEEVSERLARAVGSESSDERRSQDR